MLRIFRTFGNAIATSRFLTNSNQFQQSMPFYAVAAGWEVGIFDTWAICEKKVKVFSKPIYKKFKTREEAEAFLKAHGVSVDSVADSYNRSLNAVPIRGTPKKKKDFGTELKKLVEQRKLSKLGSSYRKWESSSEESGSEDEVKPQPATSEIKECWPDDVTWEEDDEDILLAAVAEVEGVPENHLKTKTPFEGPSSSKNFKKYSHESKIWEPIGLKKIGNFEFPIDSEGFVIVYTDGSCINNGKANAVAGFGVYFCERHTLNVAKPVCGRVTNNAGEIQAAIYAIRIAKDFGIKKLCISTDSQFLINAVTSWMKSWKRNGWKLKSGEPVKNKDDFVIIDGLLDGSIQIKWNYVKGHSGIIGNAKADSLARQGAALYKQIEK